ncbi:MULTISPECIES: IclR family transcriptional regulator [Halorussus]|uniref:IclR family transcriptional regulator n=1 Tax=Halorussus TaxID=1070314 RepID=UPI000E212E2A|nr:MULTISPECIES: IclR family transcriptional regulator [Halorussus]NHN61630.1 IclR family transcriptional regulator [Halorussus sp. JP-T4]
MDGPDKEKLKTIERGFSILEWIRENDGGEVAEVAAALDMSTSTVHRYLDSLHSEGYLVKEGGVYHLSLNFLTLGEQARTRKDVYTNAKDYTRMLSDESGCRSSFVVEEHGRGVYLYTSPGDHGVWTRSTIGKRVPLHVTAAGKSILAFLPDERVVEIVDEHGLTRETEHSITDEDELHEELARVRENGYAFNDEEQIAGVIAVGAPVENRDGEVIGAFSVSGPANRLTEDWFREELPSIVLGLTSEFELRLTLS